MNELLEYRSIEQKHLEVNLNKYSRKGDILAAYKDVINAVSQNLQNIDNLRTIFAFADMYIPKTIYKNLRERGEDSRNIVNMSVLNFLFYLEEKFHLDTLDSFESFKKSCLYVFQDYK